MSQNPYRITSSDSITIIQIPAIYQLTEMGAVRDLYKRSLGKRGCSSCRKRKQKPSYLAPSVGSALLRAIRNGRSSLLYNSLAKQYSITGPIQLDVGPCKTLLKG